MSLSRKKSKFYKCQQFDLSDYVEKVEVIPGSIERVTEPVELHNQESSLQQKFQQEIDSIFNSLKFIEPLRMKEILTRPESKEFNLDFIESIVAMVEKERGQEPRPHIITYERMIQLENERFINNLEPIRPLRIIKKAILEPMEKPLETPKTLSDNIREFFELLKSKHLNNKTITRAYIDAR